MRVENGIVEDDLVLDGELQLGGMARGCVTVRSGGVLLVLGMCCRDLTLEAGARVELQGMVAGSVFNDGGQLDVLGVINGDLSTKGGRTCIDVKAVIHGAVHDNA